jgi:hypothetical protein
MAPAPTFLRPAAWALSTALLIAAPAAASASVLDVSTLWQTKSGLPTYCKDAIQRRFVIQGPGRLTMSLTLTPYRSAGKNAYIPVTWTLYKPDGSTTGWGDTPFAGYLYGKSFVAGREQGNWVEGAPLELQRVWNLDARRYDVGVNLGAPCQSYGGGGFAQYGQAQHLVMNFAAGTPSAPTTSPPTPPAATRELFNNGNGGAVYNGPSRQTVIAFQTATFVSKITDYHWNNGAGARPGTIALRSASGQVFGPWRATLQGKGYWVAAPGVVLPAGSYTVIDSDPGTWSQNAGSGGAGMSWLEGRPAG